LIIPNSIRVTSVESRLIISPEVSEFNDLTLIFNAFWISRKHQIYYNSFFIYFFFYLFFFLFIYFLFVILFDISAQSRPTVFAYNKWNFSSRVDVELQSLLSCLVLCIEPTNLPPMSPCPSWNILEVRRLIAAELL
jgi:hypothetical protein